MKTATQTTLAGVIESLREQIAEAEAAARQCDDEIRHLQGAPAGKDEVLAVVGGLIETVVAEARRPLADALLALSRNSSQLHSPGYIASFVKGQAALLQPGRHLCHSRLHQPARVRHALLEGRCLLPQRLERGRAFSAGRFGARAGR